MAAMEPSLAKRRTRIKVNKQVIGPPSDASLAHSQLQTLVLSAELSNVDVPLTSDIPGPTIRENDSSEVSLHKDGLLFEVPAISIQETSSSDDDGNSEAKLDALLHEVDQGCDDSIDSSTFDIEDGKSNAVSSPHGSQKTALFDTEEDNNKVNNTKDGQGDLPPVPAPRTFRIPDKVEEAVQCSPEHKASPVPQKRDKSGKDKGKGKGKKKRKAAEVLSSVLKRESKKLPQVATVLQESRKLGSKDDFVDDIGSPEDSPHTPPTLGKVYVQHKHGFSLRDWAEVFKKQEEACDGNLKRNLADVALYFHALWTRLMTFSHGIVAGIACCHTLAVAAALASTQYNLLQFVQFYHFLSLKIYWAVYVFNSLCLISCFDRLDLGNVSKDHMKALASQHGNFLVTIGYLLSMALSLAAHKHTAAIEAYATKPELWSLKELQEWHWLVTFRDALLLLTWIFISFSPHSDLLHVKLQTIAKNHDVSNSRWHFPLRT